RLLIDPRFLGKFCGLMAIGLTPFLFEPIRAGQFPALNEGDVTACTTHFAWSCTLSAETGRRTEAHITRQPYGEPPFIMRKAPMSAQFGMYWLYFKWQWLRDAAGRLPGLQSALAVLFLALGLAGGITHWKRDRASFWYYATLVFTVTVPLIIYLNFYY